MSIKRLVKVTCQQRETPSVRMTASYHVLLKLFPFNKAGSNKIRLGSGFLQLLHEDHCDHWKIYGETGDDRFLKMMIGTVL